MHNMYSGAALLVLGVLGSPWAMYNTAWADDVVVTYAVVTNDPSCTALRMENIGAVTRLTPLRDNYNLTEIVGGVPLFIEVPEDQALDVVQSLLEMPQILGVQSVDSSMVSNHTAPPLEIDPNSYINTILTNYYPTVPQSIEETLRDAIIRSDGAAGVVSSGNPTDVRERVTIFVHNITSMVAYLEGNGAKVHNSRSVDAYNGFIHSILADIPASLAVPLSERDDFYYMRTVGSIISLGHGGDHTTEGLELHQSATAWQGAGVIDRSFTNILLGERLHLPPTFSR